MGFAATLVTLLVASGCNQIFGVHTIDPDPDSGVEPIDATPACAIDRFDDPSLTGWSTFGLTSADGKLRLLIPSMANATANARRPDLDFTGAAIRFELVQLVIGGTASSSLRVRFSNLAQAVELDFESNGQVTARADQAVGAIYDPTTMRNWEIAFEGPTIVFRYSGDGETFINFFEAASTLVDPIRSDVAFELSTLGTDHPALTVDIDNFEIVTAACIPNAR